MPIYVPKRFHRYGIIFTDSTIEFWDMLSLSDHYPFNYDGAIKKIADHIDNQAMKDARIFLGNPPIYVGWPGV